MINDWFAISVACALLGLQTTTAWSQATPANQDQSLAALRDEISSSLHKRDIAGAFETYREFTGILLDDSAGQRAWYDKTGNARLTWIDGLLRRPLDVFAESEKFTRELHAEAIDRERGIAGLIFAARQRLDVAPPPPPSRAMKASEASGERWRHEGVAASQPSTVPAEALADPAELGAELNQLVDTIVAVRAASSRVSILTRAGRIEIGTPGSDTYDLQDANDIVAVIDPGGDDTYLEGAVNPDRPVLIVIDLAGNDTYRGAAPGIQGGAILGASLLIDQAGDDIYEAQDVAQGACVGGVGILIDENGNDRYVGRKRAQGSALAGVGILIDRGAGDDEYRGALWCQGVGSSLGMGLLDDEAGNDTYYAGGLLADGYPDTPGYDAWSQGVGVGPRGVANGGIGILLDGAGDDSYEADYFSHGGGYWFAAGFARDFSGNDVRHGSTRTTFDGRSRPDDVSTEELQQRFLRYGIGFGCHYGIGIVLDDAGDDQYGAGFEIVAQAISWDLSVGAILDFAGNDRYLATSDYAQGVADQAGLAVLFDAAGDDHYAGSAPGGANAAVYYHMMPDAGGSFSFLIDLAGHDQYDSGLTNSAEHQQKSPNGFVIDR